MNVFSIPISSMILCCFITGYLTGSLYISGSKAGKLFILHLGQVEHSPVISRWNHSQCSLNQKAQFTYVNMTVDSVDGDAPLWPQRPVQEPLSTTVPCHYHRIYIHSYEVQPMPFCQMVYLVCKMFYLSFDRYYICSCLVSKLQGGYFTL